MGHIIILPEYDPTWLNSGAPLQDSDFESANNFGTDIVELGSDRIIEVAEVHPSVATATYGKVRLATGTTVNLGTRATMDPIFPYNGSLETTLIDTDTVYTVYGDSTNSEQMRGVVATLSGQIITPGTPGDIGTDNMRRGVMMSPATNQALLLYVRTTPTITTHANLFTFAGGPLVPTIASTVVIDGSNAWAREKMCRMDDGRYLALGYTFFIGHRIYITIMSIAGTTVSRDTYQVFQFTANGSETKFPEALENVENDYFAFVYENSGSGLSLEPLQKDGGDVLNAGTPAIVTPILAINGADTTYLGNDKLFVTWADGVDNNVYGRIYQMNNLAAPTVASPTVTVGTFGTRPSCHFLGDGRIYVSWSDAALTGRHARILKI